MMRDDYLNGIICRGNQLALLEQAAVSLPEKASPVRWIVAAAFGAIVALFPSVCAAHVFFQMI